MRRQRSAPAETAPEVSNKILTIPNLLSLLRLAGVPVFLWLVLVEHADLAAAILLIISGATDWLDGQLARRFGQVTQLGRLLDPVADRLYIAATVIAFVVRDIVPLWLAIALLARDVLLAGVVPLLWRHGYGPLSVNFVGKVGTLCLLFAFPFLLVATMELPLHDVVVAVGWAFAIWGLALYWIAGLLYLRQAMELLGKVPIKTPS